jgi:putative flippase GtrA
MTAELEVQVGKLEQMFPVVKKFRFAIAGMIGFGVTELVLSAGLLIVYGKLVFPHTSFSSIGLLGLDVLALVVGVSASFFINERITVKVSKDLVSGEGGRIERFLRFQGVSGVGNAGIIVVQLILLTALDISPLLGAIIGAVVTYPIVYFISINYVWKARQVR